MSQYQNLSVTVAAEAAQEERAAFLQRTYNHVAGALFVFAVLLAIAVNTPFAEQFTKLIMGFGWIGMLGVVFGFYFVSGFAQNMAYNGESTQTQYMGLGIFILAETIIFTPLIFIASLKAPHLIPAAGIITLALFVALSFIAITSKKDFSFLQGIVTMGIFVAMGAIVASMIFSFSLGVIFSSFMIALMGAAILYQTSTIMRTFPTNMHVAASLMLFASIATMFFYVLDLLLSLQSD